MPETFVPRSMFEAQPAVSSPAPAEAIEGLAPVRSTAAAAIAGRYEFLDAIRGLAAVLVAVQHGSEMLRLPLGRSGAVMNLGETGVVAFFLVSGFIIPRSLERHGSLKAFWVGRAFRLYPAYWISLAGALLLIAVGRSGSPFQALAHPGLAVLANVAMLQRVFGVPQALGVYWTLSLELVFYLLCSVLFMCGLLGRSALWLWVAMVADGLVQGVAALFDRSLPAGILGLVLSACFGAVAFRALTDAAARRTLRLASLPVVGVLTLGFYLRFARFPVPHAMGEQPWLVVEASWVLGYALFFGLFALRRRQFPRLLLWLGRISYSFYLLHALVLMTVPALRSGWGTLLVDLLATALLADLSFRLIERPALLLQRRLFPLPRD